MDPQHAPDKGIGAEGATGKVVQAMQIDLARDVVRDMKKSARQGLTLGFGQHLVGLYTPQHIKQSKEKTDIVSSRSYDTAIRPSLCKRPGRPSDKSFTSNSQRQTLRRTEAYGSLALSVIMSRYRSRLKRLPQKYWPQKPHHRK